MACHHICTRDRDTGEIFCPAFHGWVEHCPYDDDTRDHDDVEDESEAK